MKGTPLVKYEPFSCCAGHPAGLSGSLISFQCSPGPLCPLPSCKVYLVKVRLGVGKEAPNAQTPETTSAHTHTYTSLFLIIIKIKIIPINPFNTHLFPINLLIFSFLMFLFYKLCSFILPLNIFECVAGMKLYISLYLQNTPHRFLFIYY